MISQTELDRLSDAAHILRKASKSVWILKAIAWPPGIAAAFFDSGAKDLPKPEYEGFDPSDVFDAVDAAEALIDGDSPVHKWLLRTAEDLRGAGSMRAAVGTQAFSDQSCELFGVPTNALLDGQTTSLDLAQQMNHILSGFTSEDLVPEPPEMMDAAEMAERLSPRIKDHFGASAPNIEITDEIGAKALAGTGRIRLRKSAAFSSRDVVQLLQHEAYVHIATSLNGRAQDKFPILASGHSGTTRTQEGLAVFAEIISGVLDPRRMRRLAHRTLAIQMALDGADFIELYNFFLEQTDAPRESFESARRIVRGGLVTGGAPFTKDGVYLDGLVRVHNYLRSAVQRGEVGNFRILFAGKMDLDDIPALMMLKRAGVLTAPKFLPPWISDLRFLVTYMAYSSFLNQVKLGKVEDYYDDLFAAMKAE